VGPTTSEARAPLELALARQTAIMFSMRSRIGTWLILLTCAGTFPALTSCDGPAANRNDLGDRSQTSSVVTASPLARPHATVAVSRAAPATDSLHFDLYCELHGRIVSDAHLELANGTYPANVSSWDYDWHDIVDLQTMQICAAGQCEIHGPNRIARLTPERITIYDAPGVTISIRRRDLRYYQRQEDLGRVSVTRGRCRKGEFSGFPSRSAG